MEAKKSDGVQTSDAFWQTDRVPASVFQMAKFRVSDAILFKFSPEIPFHDRRCPCLFPQLKPYSVSHFLSLICPDRGRMNSTKANSH